MAYRLAYSLRLRWGVLRRSLPTTEWSRQPLKSFVNNACPTELNSYAACKRQHCDRFFLQHDRLEEYRNALLEFDETAGRSTEAADGICSGLFPMFGSSQADLGIPPEWHRSPMGGAALPACKHWSEIDDFSHGDIRTVWELNRFSFVFPLVRSYWRTGNDKYAEMFWQLVESWRVANPPQAGPNWKCGQEVAIRSMAWIFGLYGLLASTSTSARRIGWLAQMIAVSGHRIEANLDYALQQQNNHGISEATGLWTIGLMFPEFRRAARWIEIAQNVLESEARNLIYDDGVFCQHSTNYQRVALHDFMWAIRLGDINGRPLSPQLRESVRKAGHFLFQIQDSESGRVPSLGQNDGSQVLPLSHCAHDDYRPVVQSCHYLTTGKRCLPPGPWDEELLWLFGPDSKEAPIAERHRENLAAESGGYYTLRNGRNFAFVHCGSFRHRPSHADLLHVDLWWRGQNIAVDAGTFSYNSPAPWDNALAATEYHNTVTVDAFNQMERASRFLWLPWCRGWTKRNAKSARGFLHYWEGEHDGYYRLEDAVTYRRGILRVDEEHFLVIDRLVAHEKHKYRLHWLLADHPYRVDEDGLELQTRRGGYNVQIACSEPGPQFAFTRADECTPRGWRASDYGFRQPAISVSVETQGTEVTFWSLFGPAAQLIQHNNDCRIQTEGWSARVACNGPTGMALVDRVELDGEVNDRLEISNSQSQPFSAPHFAMQQTIAHNEI